MVSPMLTCEDAYLLARAARAIDERAILAIGPIPRRGEDRLYPPSAPPEKAFRVYAEKAPNARGVRRVLEAMAGPGSKALAYEDLLRELRAGATTDGKTKVKSPSSTLSTAEAISVVNQGLSLAAHFGDATLRAHDLAGGIIGAVVKDPVQDRLVWQEYLETVVKERDGWKDLYRACKDVS